MKVVLNAKVTQLDPPQTETLPFSRSPKYDSSISKLRAIPKNRIVHFLSQAYEAIKRKLTIFFNWVRSWFVSPPEEKEVDFIKTQSADGTEVKYRIVIDGEGTKSEIRLGKNYASLLISNPDVKDIAKLSEAIDQVMKTKKIDCVQTNYPSQAYLFWKCGLKTEGLVEFNFTPDDENTFIRTVIQKAMDNKGTLKSAAQDALLRVEGKIVRTVYYEQYAFENIFKPDLCRGMLNNVEGLFNYSFNLQPLIQLAEREKEVDYAKNLKRIVNLNVNNNSPEVSYKFEISLEDLFILMEATKTPMSNAFIHLSNTIFTKRT